MPTATTTRGAILVTGAGGGLGTALVARLATLGYQVFAGMHHPTTETPWGEASAARITPLPLDITEAASIDAAMATLRTQLGTTPLVGLINNAGIIIEGPLELVPIADLRREFEVNVIGQIAVTQAVLPLLRQGHGRIINVGAVTAYTAMPYLGAISASKAAIASLSDALRMELAPWDIPVVLVEPSALQTTIFAKAGSAADAAYQQTSRERQALYAPAIAAVRASLAKQPVSPPEVVVTTIVGALQARRPRTRYVVGRGASTVRMLRRLPDGTRDRLLRSQFGLTAPAAQPPRSAANREA